MCRGRRATLRPGGRARYPTPQARQWLHLPRRSGSTGEWQDRGAHRPIGDTTGAWRNVWICPDQRGHLLATGKDDRGRTQYLYHPKWRELRDLLNFYRLLVFGEQLPTIRAHVAAQLRRRTLDRERVLAAMLRIIDESAVRIGSEEYAEDNDSFGLSTLTQRHLRVHGRTLDLAFPGKSPQRVHVSIDDAPVARAVESLLAVPGRHVFRADGTAVSVTDVNDRLLELTSQHITAKDSRTWNGTLAAFAHLRDANGTDRSPRHIAVAAIDEAAQQLANTRAVARAHYVHPHVVAAFTSNRFEEYLAACTVSRHEHMDRDECALLAFLRVLLEREFDHRGDRPLTERMSQPTWVCCQAKCGKAENVKRSDRSLELIRRGYLFGPSVRAGTPTAQIRLFGRRTGVVAGVEGVRSFYDESEVQRQGAVPRLLRRTLFGEGAVHGLDGEAHRHRKAMFLALLTPQAAASIAALAAQRWDAWAADRSPGQRVVLLDAAVQVHGAAVCQWAGVPADRFEPALAHDLMTIVDGFGSIGLRHLRARQARRRADRWAAALITDVRQGNVAVPADSATEVIATHRDLTGALLPAKVAGVELLNILRPTVAVAHFAAFTGLALRDHPRWRDRIADEQTLEAFAQEVRRYYPFVPVLGARFRTTHAPRARRLPMGDRLVLDVYGTLHEPAYWEAATRFDPGRFLARAPDPDLLIPQGGGPPTGHRCPGERVALELIKATARLLTAINYDLPRQDLSVPMRRMPTRPRSGFILTLTAATPAAPATQRAWMRD